ncbi:HAD family hydrolase [uncultured Olsenella sp.]|uniref:HAD family hydrolase n=1 Tax=uncultured Olsenella sp. TaxID=190764 RepID=UPI0026DA743B|nr:HAD hydrolase family protein [uncultured Olsenella sp.]
METVDVLCERLGIGLDQVAVFGDGGNDVNMLEHVPLSFAVEGATPEAKAAASWRLGRVEDEAVADAIEALVRGEMPAVRG